LQPFGRTLGHLRTSIAIMERALTKSKRGRVGKEGKERGLTDLKYFPGKTGG